MQRRRFLVLGTVLLAGCGGDGDDSTPTTAPTETPPPEDGGGADTPTPDGVENRTGEDVDVGGSGEFQPTVTFNSCTDVTVEADEAYSAVALGLVGGSTVMHDEGYEGATTLEADTSINEVLVWSAAGDKSNKVNPDVDACPKPE